MSILYRRFVLVAAFISALGAITANVIQETRSAKVQPFSGFEQINPVSPACPNAFHCDIRHGMNSIFGTMHG